MTVCQKFPKLAEHFIHTGDTPLVQLPIYQIPHAYCANVEGENNEMLAHLQVAIWQHQWFWWEKRWYFANVCYRILVGRTRVDAHLMPTY
jgi:hypothetical protein